ncbi:MAG: mechanosensitive ion channel family protein [Spirochaetia bacterium]|jgi:small conductance mechanosensitive channel|nr:mechanosensitive ion channel family protein [Spirochaetia bacterium]
MKEQILALWNTHGDSITALGGKILFAFLVALGGRVLIHIAGALIRRATSRIPLFDETFASMFRIVISYTILIVCIIMILDSFGVNTASLIALLGAAGVAVGLALKDTLSNIASGIILLLLRSYRKGDYIEFGACAGTVRDMDLFTTSLETPDGIFISAPNSSIWGLPLKNYSRNRRRRMDISIGISYSDSIDTAFKLMRQIAAEEKRFLPDPAPQIMVQSLGESSVNITLRAWAHADDYWPAYWDLMRGLKDRTLAAGLTIPFPQQDVHIVAEPQPHNPEPTGNLIDDPRR